MGSWGSGNFDSDTAADHLSLLTQRLVDEVAEAMSADPEEIEPDEYWGVAVPCNLELLCLLAERRYVGIVLPEPDTITSWKRHYLAVWDGRIDAVAPTSQYRERRRSVLVDTFDRLAEASRHLS
jgi:hypothetical protein